MSSLSNISLIVPPAGTPLQTLTDTSIPSPPDNTPTNVTSPIIDDHDDTITSIIDYHQEQMAPTFNLSTPPLGYIHNNQESWYFYPIYIKNQLYTEGGEDKYILAPFIKYDLDYTQVHGTQGMGCEVHTLPVQIGRSVWYSNYMTTTMWSHFWRGSDQQFLINTALEQLGDPRLKGEIKYFRGKADVLNTLNGLLHNAQHKVNNLMKEVVTIEGEVRRCQQRLQRANTYDEI